MANLHATCVALDGAGVLLRGAPGSGKSDLALRLIDAGARLVADDRVELRAVSGAVRARAPAATAGLIEVRGLGVVRVPALDEAALALVVDLGGAAPERLPAPSSCRIAGVGLPCITLDAFAVSAAARIRLAVAVLATGGSLAGALGDAAQ
jgi:HPr kinase/phosphorylase